MKASKVRSVRKHWMCKYQVEDQYICREGNTGNSDYCSRHLGIVFDLQEQAELAEERRQDEL